MPRCQDCGAELKLDVVALVVDAYVICPNCGVELRVTSVRPLALALVGEDVESSDTQSS